MNSGPEIPPEMKRVSPWVRRSLLVLSCLVLVGAWLINTPPGLLGKSDALAYAVCHRIGSHSFYFGDRPFSLCARCSGQYLGFLWGFLFLSWRGKKRSGFPSRWLSLLLGGLVLFYVLDGLNSFWQSFPGRGGWTLYQPTNVIRLFSGLGMGLAISGFYYPLMGQTLWSDFLPESPLRKFLDWLVYLGGAALIGLLVLWQNPLISYYLILASTGGLLALLTLLYTVIWVLLSKRENSFKDLKELGWWLLAGFGTAMLQIALADGLRYWLTGTWSGFAAP